MSPAIWRSDSITVPFPENLPYSVKSAEITATSVIFFMEERRYKEHKNIIYGNLRNWNIYIYIYIYIYNWNDNWNYKRFVANMAWLKQKQARLAPSRGKTLQQFTEILRKFMRLCVEHVSLLVGKLLECKMVQKTPYNYSVRTGFAAMMTFPLLF